jgi:chaperone required for assembly of F1-ATPase
MPNYVATIYGRTIKNDSMNGLHVQATAIANIRREESDDLSIISVDGKQLPSPVVFRRRNRKMPGNAIVFGKWERIN